MRRPPRLGDLCALCGCSWGSHCADVDGPRWPTAERSLRYRGRPGEGPFFTPKDEQ